jgi:hypothetical protein
MGVVTAFRAWWCNFTWNPDWTWAGPMNYISIISEKYNFRNTGISTSDNTKHNPESRQRFYFIFLLQYITIK